MLDMWIIHNLVRVPLGMNTLEEGAVVVVEEGTLHEKREKTQATGRKVRLITDIASTALGRREK
jgi:hypothetical protein